MPWWELSSTFCTEQSGEGKVIFCLEPEVCLALCDKITNRQELSFAIITR